MKPKTPPQPEHPETLFFDVVRKLNKGRTPSDLSDALAKVTAACADTGKKGKVTLTLTIAPIKDTESAYEIRDSIKTDLPARNRKLAILYGTPDGMLASAPPEQEQFSFERDASVVAPNPAAQAETPKPSTKTKTA